MLAVGGSLSCSGTESLCAHQLGPTPLLLHHAPRRTVVVTMERRESAFAV